MTYCVGLLVNEGLVLATDSRTNAGVDHISTVSKMHVFDVAEDRLFVVLSAGNLATTQEVIDHIRRDIQSGTSDMLTCNYLFEAAEYVGRVSREVQDGHSAVLAQSGVSGDATFLIAGQIQGEDCGLMMIYPQGNYIAASEDTPFLQIGESKYGKPVLDRLAVPEMSLAQGIQLLLVSQSSTARSNVSVGPPFEVAAIRPNQFKMAINAKITEKDPYWDEVQQAWEQAISQAFTQLPSIPWSEAPVETTQEVEPEDSVETVSQMPLSPQPSQPLAQQTWSSNVTMDQNGTNQSTIDQNTVNQSTVNPSTVNQGTVDQSTINQTAVDQNNGEQGQQAATNHNQEPFAG